MFVIKQTYPGIFAILVPDNYERAMLFCRIQEYYESSNNLFKNKKFSFWDYHKWYSKKNRNCFTYPADWSGFNFPTEVALKCQTLNNIETPYDTLMNKILSKIRIKKSYIIGVKSLKCSTYRHELAHGFYYTNNEYKKEMLNVTKYLDKISYNNLKNNLLKLGYHKSVVDDEIQAYLSTGADSRITRGLKNKNILNRYRQIFKRFL